MVVAVVTVVADMGIELVASKNEGGQVHDMRGICVSDANTAQLMVLRDVT